MPASRATAKTFNAVLERSGDRLNWTIIRIPFDAAKLWGKRGQLRVKGEINGFAFRSALFPTGQGTHVLMVNKKMQAGGKVVPGNKAQFRLEPDAESREFKPSQELERIFRQSKQLQKYFDSLNFSMRRYIALWVEEGKHADTRRRRAEQMAERLMATMEAERDLPPVLQVAMQHNPKARAGWNLMPPGHRRSHLLSIFYYRDPESRARRIAKAVQEMIAYAEKRQLKP
ncbi:MAG TPA: YdeI/OmpD-associated family protein [Candidatus Angelobacter sp.]